MQIDFYGVIEDKIALLDFIFSQTSFKIVELYSPYGQELREFKTTNDVASCFDLTCGKNQIHLTLWDPAFGEVDIVRKVELNPKYCNGNTFRYAANGWSLLQLYFNSVTGSILHASKLQGFNEKGALAKDTAGAVNATRAASLNWSGIRSAQKMLKNYLTKKLTTRKIGSYFVLQNADMEVGNGNINLA